MENRFIFIRMGEDMNLLIRMESTMANFVATLMTENYNDKMDTTMENFKESIANFFKMEN